ncbi:hypothetical protein GALL_171600 [mine drainage metagenome]|uniref:TNase-like domain-containing protein n=1 Tax=mine drainage metagenome TaxID=410659 RepID=A0A1J5RY01_9ZZZZ
MRRTILAVLLLWGGVAWAEPVPSGLAFLGWGRLVEDGAGGLRTDAGAAVTLAGVRPLPPPPSWQGVGLRLYAAGPPDRWERQPVYAADAQGRWLQAEWLRQGLAHLDPAPVPGLERLRAAEDAARADRRGLWAGAAMVAHGPDQAVAWPRRYQIIEGRVMGISLPRGAVGLLLGDVKGQGLMVRIDRRLRRRFSGDPALLRGRMIRVRGPVRGGGRAEMDLADPAQLELLDGPWPARMKRHRHAAESQQESP